MIEKFDVPKTRGTFTNSSGRRKRLMHYLITGKLLRFPETLKDDVLAVVQEMKERYNKEPAGQVTFYKKHEPHRA